MVSRFDHRFACYARTTRARFLLENYSRIILVARCYAGGTNSVNFRSSETIIENVICELSVEKNNDCESS
jgi:hypothetical protein